MVGTIVGMLRAFPKLTDTTFALKQDALAFDISIALYTTAIGMAVSIVGIVLLCIALFGVKYRPHGSKRHVDYGHPVVAQSTRRIRHWNHRDALSCKPQR